MYNKAIYWFRNDLRLSDNVALTHAIANAREVVPVYIFDPKDYRQLKLGFSKTSTFRAKFVLESVQNLRDNLRANGQDLVIRIGSPDKVLSELAVDFGIEALFASKEATEEETEMEASVAKKLKAENVEIDYFWQSTLHHPRDLPFWISKMPDIFTPYREAVEKTSKIRAILPKISPFDFPKNIPSGSLPEIYELILFSEYPKTDDRAAFQLKGGESSALARLNDYLFETKAVRHYKETRNEMIGLDFSSKLSVWLALGCISPRQVYAAVQEHEKQFGENESTYWLIFELLWRDFFRFIALKSGGKFFKVHGIKHIVNHSFRNDDTAFKSWINSQTGVPIVDACMNELKATGYLSNRGRQIVCSYLVHDLKVNWTWGAKYFESQLIDYDVCSNWGNWNYIAGVGNDPRPNRRFDPETQTKNYDPKGDYISLWKQS